MDMVNVGEGGCGESLHQANHECDLKGNSEYFFLIFFLKTKQRHPEACSQLSAGNRDHAG